MSRCDNCGADVSHNEAYHLARWQGRLPIVCGKCLLSIARGRGQAERAARGRAA